MSSGGKFASITANLLARKGEARPWAALNDDLAAAPPPPAVQPSFAAPLPPPTPVRPAVAAPPPPPIEHKDKSCAIRMSAHDFERLGILAVKQGVPRQQILKQALSDFLAARAAQYGCACLGACNNSCGGGA